MLATLAVTGCAASAPPTSSRATAATTHQPTPAPHCTEQWSTTPIPLPPGAGPSYRESSPTSLRGLSGRGGDLWAVGSYRDKASVEKTLTSHWDGVSWRTLASPDVAASQVASATGPAGGDRLNAVAELAPDNVWAVGSYTVPAPPAQQTAYVSPLEESLVMHRTGAGWTFVSSPDISPNDSLLAVSAASATDIWAVGIATFQLDPALALPATQLDVPFIVHWDGARWSTVRAALPGVDPSNPGQLTALSQQHVTQLHGGSLAAVHAFSANDVWAVGTVTTEDSTAQSSTAATLTEHWDGTSWHIVPAPDVHVAETKADAADHLNAVGGVSGHDVWAVGSAQPQGTLAVHWDGSAWSLVPSPETGINAYLGSIAAVAPNDVWAVGDVISRWDGQSWREIAAVNAKPVEPLQAVVALSATDVWMVGTTDFIHYRCT